MKKVFAVLLVTLSLCISAKAQTISNTGLEYRGGAFYQDGVKIPKEMLSSALGEQTYEDIYKPANGLRIAGITCLSVGGAATAFGAGMFIYALVSDSPDPGQAIGDVFLAIPGTIFGLSGAAVTITGGILYGIGNKKLKNIVPASNGVGIAFRF